MKKITLILVALSTVLAFASCDKNEGNKDLGLQEVYMPQASINGGVAGEYPVPMNGSKNYAFNSDGTGINITLGVYRSGMGNLESFDVEVYADGGASAERAVKDAKMIALKADYYSLPATATVPDGERETTFNLEVNIDKLAAAYPEGHDNKFVLVVGIKNPTKYELNASLSKTTVIIDGATFIEKKVDPVPPTPPADPTLAGDFSKPECWTVLMNEKAQGITDFVQFKDGMLVFTPEPAEDIYDAIACIYQETKLEAGATYHYNLEIQTSPTEHIFYEDPWGGPIYFGTGFFGKEWSKTLDGGPWKSGWDKDYRGVDNNYAYPDEGIENSFLWLDLEGEKQNSSNALYTGTDGEWKHIYDVDSWRQPEIVSWKDQGNFIAQDATTYVFIWVTQRVRYANPILLRNISIEKVEN